MDTDNDHNQMGGLLSESNKSSPDKYNNPKTDNENDNENGYSSTAGGPCQTKKEQEEDAAASFGDLISLQSSRSQEGDQDNKDHGMEVSDDQQSLMDLNNDEGGENNNDDVVAMEDIDNFGITGPSAAAGRNNKGSINNNNNNNNSFNRNNQNSSDEEDQLNIFSQSEKSTTLMKDKQELLAKNRRRRKRRSRKVVFHAHKITNPQKSEMATGGGGVSGMTNCGLDLNGVGPEVQRMMQELLTQQKITEYSQVAKVLNSELCEPTLQIQLEIDTLPDLNWTDGSMSMTLKCSRHLKQYTPGNHNQEGKRRQRRKKAKRISGQHRGLGVFEAIPKPSATASQEEDEEDIFSQQPQKDQLQQPSDDEMLEDVKPKQQHQIDSDSEDEAMGGVGQIFGRPSVICPVRIYLKTIENYWQLDTGKMELKKIVMTHLPPLLKPRPQTAVLSSSQAILKQTIENLTSTNSFGLTIPHQQAQQRRVPNKTANEIIGTKQQNEQSVSAQNFISSMLQLPQHVPQQEPAEKAQIQYFQPHKTDNNRFQQPQLITLKQGTVSIAQNFTVDVIDSSAFLGRKPSAQAQTAQGKASTTTNGGCNVGRSRVNFKKNIDRSRSQQIQKRRQQQEGEAQLLAVEIAQNGQQCESSWFINEEERLFKGTDYTTKEEDTNKLLKFMRANLSKHDFCRYETCSETNLVKSIIISTSQMKEQYLMYRDVLMICPCYRKRQKSRFGMLSLGLYGVNSLGRNQLFALCLVKDEKEDRETFEFVFRQFLEYMDDHVPRHILMKRQSLTSALFQGVKRVLTKKFSVKIPLSVEDPVVFCPYSLHEDLKARFSFLQREERPLYQILIALPLVLSEIDLEMNLKELSKVKFNQLDNLREYLRLLNCDKHLWARSLRLPYNETFQTLDVSLQQRNEAVEHQIMQMCELGTELICKEFMIGLAEIEKAEFVYSHEYRSINNHQSLLVAQEPILNNFVAPNFPKYVLQRCKHNLFRGLKLRLVKKILVDKEVQEFKVLAPLEGNAEYCVTTSLETKKLQCSCGQSQLSGMPCQHELFVCRKLNLEPTVSLFFKQRWFLKYAEKVKERLYAEKPTEGIMCKHMKRDYSLQKSTQLEKLKTSNHPDLVVKDSAISKRSKKSKRSRRDKEKTTSISKPKPIIADDSTTKSDLVFSEDKIVPPQESTTSPQKLPDKDTEAIATDSQRQIVTQGKDNKLKIVDSASVTLESIAASRVQSLVQELNTISNVKNKLVDNIVNQLNEQQTAISKKRDKKSKSNRKRRKKSSSAKKSITKLAEVYKFDPKKKSRLQIPTRQQQQQKEKEKQQQQLQQTTANCDSLRTSTPPESGSQNQQDCDSLKEQGGTAAVAKAGKSAANNKNPAKKTSQQPSSTVVIQSQANLNQQLVKQLLTDKSIIEASLQNLMEGTGNVDMEEDLQSCCKSLAGSCETADDLAFQSQEDKKSKNGNENTPPISQKDPSQSNNSLITIKLSQPESAATSKRRKIDEKGRFLKMTPKAIINENSVFNMDDYLKGIKEAKPFSSAVKDPGLSKRTDQFFRDRAFRAKKLIIAKASPSGTVTLTRIEKDEVSSQSQSASNHTNNTCSSVQTSKTSKLLQRRERRRCRKPEERGTSQGSAEIAIVKPEQLPDQEPEQKIDQISDQPAQMPEQNLKLKPRQKLESALQQQSTTSEGASTAKLDTPKDHVWRKETPTSGITTKVLGNSTSLPPVTEETVF